MEGRRRSLLALCLITSCIFPISPATSSETVYYSYDAAGRLKKVSHIGSVNNGASACYTYDKAANRTNVKVETAVDCTTGLAPPSFSINDVAITEGGSLGFTVTRSGNTGGSNSVSFATANGSAAAGLDYSATSGSLVFLAGETSKPVTVSTMDDPDLESAETVVVNLSNATGGASISDAQGVGTINDNDATPPPSFAINNATGVEGGSLVFTVTKIGSTQLSYSVNFATADGDANSSTDYVAASGTVTFAPNETTKTITIATRNNSFQEGFEIFYVNLSGASGGAWISDNQGIGEIQDDGDTGCQFC